MREVWSTTQDVLMRMAHDARLRRLVENKSVRHEVVRRYVAGESITAALDVTGELLVRGRLVSLTHLAADPLDAAQAKDRRKRLRKLLRRLGQAGYAEGDRAEVSLRLGTLGARLRPDGARIALEHAMLVAQAAADVGTRVTLETENGLDVAVTLAAWRALHERFPTTGIAVQAALTRTPEDCVELAAAGARVRLSKGTARGTEMGALDRPHDVDRAYVRCLRLLVDGGADVVAATHDPRLLEIARAVFDGAQGAGVAPAGGASVQVGEGVGDGDGVAAEGGRGTAGDAVRPAGAAPIDDSATARAAREEVARDAADGRLDGDVGLAPAHRPGAREFEYGLRLGVAPGTQTAIADRGDRMRVYVPFGEDWYPYLMSRIAEEANPLLSLVRTASAR